MSYSTNKRKRAWKAWKKSREMTPKRAMKAWPEKSSRTFKAFFILIPGLRLGGESGSEKAKRGGCGRGGLSSYGDEIEKKTFGRKAMKRICVVDGQGGGIGLLLVKALKETFKESVEVIALGTNAIATSQMLKAGANKGASGENAICHVLPTADFILGPVGITWANAMLGEITPRMAEAVMTSSSRKILLPLSQEAVEIIGVVKEPLPHLVQAVVERIKEMWRDEG